MLVQVKGQGDDELGCAELPGLLREWKNQAEVQQLDHASQQNLDLTGFGQFYGGRRCPGMRNTKVPPMPLMCKESGSYHL